MQDLINNKKQIKSIFETYKLCKLHNKLKKRKLIKNDFFNNLSCKNVELYIKAILEHLNIDERKVIELDFIETPDNQWWKEYYSKSTYYRLKNKSYYNFLHYFKEVNGLQ